MTHLAETILLDYESTLLALPTVASVFRADRGLHGLSEFPAVVIRPGRIDIDRPGEAGTQAIAHDMPVDLDVYFRQEDGQWTLATDLLQDIHEGLIADESRGNNAQWTHITGADVFFPEEVESGAFLVTISTMCRFQTSTSDLGTAVV